MSLSVFCAVMLAAVMHAGWNILVKLKIDRFLSLFLLQLVMGGMGLVMMVFFPFPALASLPYALMSGMLHTGYNIFLARAYRDGDLSLVYPIARGTAPLLILLVTLIVAPGSLSSLAITGIIILVFGLWLMVSRSGQGLAIQGKTVFFALCTSLFIAAYTIVDGLGGRASTTASGYTGLVYVLDALFMLLWTISIRGWSVFKQIAPFWRGGLLGGGLSATAYWIVIWGMTQAPIASVAALRETSILFALLMSAHYLKEQLTLNRVMGALFIVVGAIALRLS